MVHQPVNEGPGGCRWCGKPVRGRADKHFCNDMCRNAWNNHKKSAEHTQVRAIDLALKKNRRILQGLLGEKQTCSLPEKTLLQKGFVLKYHTHHFVSPRGDEYTYCYDYGYLQIGHDRVLIVKELSAVQADG